MSSRMFTAALFIMEKIRNNSKCLSIRERDKYYVSHLYSISKNELAFNPKR